MKFGDAVELVEGLPRPHLTPHRGLQIFDHVLDLAPLSVLELGTGRGGSTIYMAAALDEIGCGSITSVDSTKNSWTCPSAQEILDIAGLAGYVSLLRPATTYTWYLKDLLRSSQIDAGLFDLIFIDGAKDFTTAALSMQMSVKLLKPGGSLVCDDLPWTYEQHCRDAVHFGTTVEYLTDDERRTAHIGAAFGLYVSECEEMMVTERGWMGWARKKLR